MTTKLIYIKQLSQLKRLLYGLFYNIFCCLETTYFIENIKRLPLVSVLCFLASLNLFNQALSCYDKHSEHHRHLQIFQLI